MDIAKEHPGEWVFWGLRTAFLSPQSSFQDDRNAIGTGAIFPVVPWLIENYFQWLKRSFIYRLL
jgi:hypothetical protein